MVINIKREYTLPGFTGGPGITNIATLPVDAIETGATFFRNEPHTSKISAGFRLGSIITKIHYIAWKILACNFSSLSAFISSLAASSFSTFFSISSGFGIGACALEAVAEGVLFIPHLRFQNILTPLSPSLFDNPSKNIFSRAIKNLDYHKQIYGDLYTPFRSRLIMYQSLYLTKDFLSSEEKENFQKDVIFYFLSFCKKTFFSLSVDEMKKMEKSAPNEKEREKKYQKLLDQKRAILIQRIGKEHAEKFERSLLPLYDTFFSKSASMDSYKEAKLIFSQFHTQMKKMIVFHIIGILALILTLVSFICLFIVSGGLASTVLLAMGFSYGLVRWALSKGFLPTDGWRFQVSLLIPSFIKKMALRIQTVAQTLLHKKA